MKRIAIDMDDVVADTLAKYLRVCHTELGIVVERSQLAGRNLFDIIGHENFPKIRTIVEHVDFFADLEVMPDSQDVIRKLTGRYEVFISSSAMEVPTSFRCV